MQEGNLPPLTAENADLVMISLLVASSRSLELDAIETAMYANTMTSVDAVMRAGGEDILEAEDSRG